MIERHWRGYNCLPKWRKPELWMDAIVVSTPQWNYVIRLPRFLIRIRFKQWEKTKDERSRR